MSVETNIAINNDDISLQGGNQDKNFLNSICQLEIQFSENINQNINGIGCLIKLKKNNSDLYCLMSSEFIIKKDYISSNKTLKLKYQNNINKEIILDKEKRYIQDFTFLNIYVVIVQILEEELEKGEKDYFLKPNMKYIKGYSKFKNRDIHILQYSSTILQIETDKIIEIFPYQYKFFYLSNRIEESSGSPIFLLNDKFVLGIHYGGANNSNFGYFIGPIIDFLNNNLNFEEILYYLGTETYEEKYEGQTKSGKREGYGKYTYKNGEIYMGQWKNDKKHFIGRQYNSNGELKYEGNFKNDKYEGKGKLYMENGDYYIGNFKNNYKSGYGTYYYEDGSIKEKEKFYFFNGRCNIDCDRLKEILCRWKILCITLSIMIIITIIIFCVILKCEKGDKEKCLTCRKNTRQCGSCNPGYELKKGECITYTFKATYSPDYNTKITLFNYTYINLILRMKIDDKYINPSTVYEFKNPGIYEVYFYFKNKEINSFSFMFSNIQYIRTISFNSLADTNKITDMSYMFAYSRNLKSVNFSNMNLEKLQNIKEIFSNCHSLSSVDLSNFNSPNLKNMYGMFSNCNYLIYVNFTNFNTKNVEIMSNLFENCNSLTSIDLSSFNTERLISMENMFSGCESIALLDLSNFDTKNVKYMNSLFYYCKSLTSIDLSNFDTKNVKDMSDMFYYCISISKLDLSKFNTKNVQQFLWMFYGCYSLKYVDISNLEFYENRISLFRDLPEAGTIILNMKYINNIEEIPSNWEIIDSSTKNY